MPEVVFVGLGTTGGWRHADRRLAEALVARGVHLRAAWPRLDRLEAVARRAPAPTRDLLQALAMRHVLGRLVRDSTDLVVVSSSIGLLLASDGVAPRMVAWLDAPVYACRPGRRNGVIRWLERRSAPRVAGIAMQTLRSIEDVERTFSMLDGPVLGLPVPVVERGPAPVERDAFGLIYAGNPWKKGLDLAVRAWGAAGASAPLKVTGISRADGTEFLRDVGCPVPSTVEWLGRVPVEEHRRLSRTASVYLSCSRREEYGNSQLEALVDGAVLVSGPCQSTAEPRALALALEPGFVSDDEGAGLESALGRGLSIGRSERVAYQARAQALLEPYSQAAFDAGVDALLEVVTARP